MSSRFEACLVTKSSLLSSCGNAGSAGVGTRGLGRDRGEAGGAGGSWERPRHAIGRSTPSARSSGYCSCSRPSQRTPRHTPSGRQRTSSNTRRTLHTKPAPQANRTHRSSPDPSARQRILPAQRTAAVTRRSRIARRRFGRAAREGEQRPDGGDDQRRQRQHATSHEGDAPFRIRRGALRLSARVPDLSR